jgi:hypothetical protein
MDVGSGAIRMMISELTLDAMQALSDSRRI